MAQTVQETVWLYRRCSTFSVVDVAVISQRQSRLRSVHRQDVQGLSFCRILRHFSHSVRMDVSAHFSALDGEEFFVVEGSGWRARRESDSQMFCHANSVHASAFQG